MISIGGGRGIIGNPGLRFIRPSPVVSSLTWLHRWDFGTTEAAPLATPHATEEGGPFTVVQTIGQMSILSAGVLTIPASSGNGNQGWYTPAITKSAGYALIIRNLNWSSFNFRFSWKETQNVAHNNAGGNRFGLSIQSGNTQIGESATANFTVQAALSSGTAYDFALILRTTGAAYYVKGGAFTGWHHLWQTPTDPAATLYAGVGNNAMVGTMTRFGVADLVGSGYSVFNGDNGLAQVYSAAPVQGESGNIDANGVHAFKITSLPTNTGDSVSYVFRRQDASNYWRITLTKDAGATCTISLDEIVAGVSTQRGSSASTVAANDWITIIPFGSTIWITEGAAGGVFTTRITYASATNFATETAYLWQTIPTGAAVSDHSGQPEYLSGSAATALDLALQ